MKALDASIVTRPVVMHGLAKLIKINSIIAHFDLFYVPLIVLSIY